uniref:Uncharacterized protein n=1 Tax=Arundo donax TaxID=35708 RepID=A0A0A8Y9E4_ARUDO
MNRRQTRKNFSVTQQIWTQNSQTPSPKQTNRGLSVTSVHPKILV